MYIYTHDLHSDYDGCDHFQPYNSMQKVRYLLATNRDLYASLSGSDEVGFGIFCFMVCLVAGRRNSLSLLFSF